MGKYLAENIANCEADFIPDAGHLWIFEHFKDVLDKLIDCQSGILPNMCFINTSHNSEYPAALCFVQIGSRWSSASGTRRTLSGNFD